MLILLGVEPLHPYGLRQRIQQWGKDGVVNVTQRNAIYQVIDRLERSGLIAVKETTRTERRPERTVYETTEEGKATAKRWLVDMLREPAQEFPEFPAALAFLDLLEPKERLAAFRERAAVLAERIEKIDEMVNAGIEATPGGVPRIFLVETEYLRAMLQAELTWTRDLVADMESGAFDA